MTINSNDAIERFLDRSWMVERISPEVMRGHRSALQLLDQWLLEHRVIPLICASAADVRALLRSPRWDAASRRYAALLGLTMRFFQSLRECKFRADDPFEALIDQELATAAGARDTVRPPCRAPRSSSVAFSGSPVA